MGSLMGSAVREEEEEDVEELRDVDRVRIEGVAKSRIAVDILGSFVE